MSPPAFKSAQKPFIHVNTAITLNYKGGKAKNESIKLNLLSKLVLFISSNNKYESHKLQIRMILMRKTPILNK